MLCRSALWAQSVLEDFPYSFAGIFKYLREEVASKTEAPRPVDISGECCAMIEAVMLAQAQEMFYEMLCAKKLADGAKSAISNATLAAVAWSVSELYNLATEAYLKPQLVKHMQREWGESSRVKAVAYEAEAHFRQAAHLEEDPNKQGIRCGHLEYADNLLNDKQQEIRLGMPELQKQIKVCFCRVRSYLYAWHVLQRPQKNIFGRWCHAFLYLMLPTDLKSVQGPKTTRM